MSTTTDVIALYTKYLNRTPAADDPGVVFYVTQIDAGNTTLSQVEIDIKGSNEYKVIELFKKHLHRFPDDVGLTFWLGQLPPNGTISLSQLEKSIADSDEAYIVLTYNSILGRDPNGTELAEWLDEFKSGTARTQLNASLSETDFALISQIKQVYQNLLDRDPETEALEFWLNKISQKAATVQDLITAIKSSQEYRDKYTVGDTPTINIDPNNLESSLKTAWKQLFGVTLPSSYLTFFLKATSGTSVYSGRGTIMADDTGVNYDIGLSPALEQTGTGTGVSITMANFGTPYAYSDKISKTSDWANFQVRNGTNTSLTLDLSLVNGTANVNTTQTLKQWNGSSWVNVTGSITLEAGQIAYIAVNIDGAWTLKGVQYWIQQYNSGAITVANVQSVWMALPEYQVTLTYKTLLDRFPDEAGFAFWTNGLTSINLTERIALLTQTIKDSDEYKTKQGQEVTDTTVTTTSTNTQTVELETKETRAYVFTYVSVLSEESAPSDPVIVDLYPGTQTVTLTMEAAPTGNFNLTHRRIYRSMTGSAGTNYYFVAEVPITQQVFEDTVASTDLAEPLPSLNWTTPPEDLKGLIAMPNGFLAGFTGQDIYFSEAYHLHAWPIEYMQSVDYPIVGLAQFGQSLVVLTNGSPYLLTGTDPASMTLEKLDFEQSCVSAKSIARLGPGIAYASPDGLAYIGPDGMNVITDGLFTRKEWQALNPSSLVGGQHDNRYYGFYDNGTKAGFVFDPKNTASPFVNINQYYSGLFNDLRNDALYGIYQGTIKKIEGSTTPLEYTWRSKKFSLPRLMTFSAWQIIASDYNDLTAKFYMDGTLVHTTAVTSANISRLPGATRGRDFEIELTGTSTVIAVHVADHVEELRNV